MKHLHFKRTPGSANGFSVVELVIVLALLGIMAAVALPMAKPAVSLYEIAGQAHAVAYDISLAKMQAASGFTQARLHVDLSNNSYRVESWNQATSSWTAQSEFAALPSGMGFGFGTLSTPPPDTQETMLQSSPCLNGVGSTATQIASTSCVIFNSRGIPIEPDTGTPVANDAIYLTDGRVVYGVSVSRAGLTQLWWTPASNAAWQKQ